MSAHFSDRGFWRWIRWISFYLLALLGGRLLQKVELTYGNQPDGALVDLIWAAFGLVAVGCLPLLFRRMMSSRIAMTRLVLTILAGAEIWTAVQILEASKELLQQPWGQVWREAGEWWGVSASIVVILAFSAPILIFEIAVTEIRNRRYRRPFDPVIVHTLWLAQNMKRKRHLWHDPRTSRRWCRDLEELAWRATDAFDLSRRAHVGDISLRRGLRSEARRAGMIYRGLIPLVVEAVDASSIDKVRENLIHGIDLMTQGDRTGILDSAPALDPLPSRPRAWLRRATPGLILISFGVAIPMLPVFEEHQQATQNLRWGLILAGAAILVSASPEVSARVNEAVNRAFSAK